MEQRKVFLHGEVEQPLWLPPRFSKFVQTYRFGEKHTWKLLVYHPNGEYAACNLFTFGGRTTPVESERGGEITANSFTDMRATLLKVRRAEGYEGKLGKFCEDMKMDAFYTPDIDREPDNEILMLMIDFAYLYFSIGSANGDYREEKPQKPNISVARSRLILPGDKTFKIP